MENYNVTIITISCISMMIMTNCTDCPQTKIMNIYTFHSWQDRDGDCEAE